MDLNKFVGMTEASALRSIQSENIACRVKSRIINGVADPIRVDAWLNMDRLNLHVEDGKVVRVSRG